VLSACEKGAKQARLVGKAQTDAGVGHCDLDQRILGVVVFEHDAQHHAAGVGELDGISDQIGQYLADTHRVAAQGQRDVGVDEIDDLQRFLISQWREQRQHIFDAFAQVERTVLDDYFAGFDLEKSRMSLMMDSKRRGRFVDGLDVLALFLIEIGLANRVVNPITPFIGVRISWLILARNSDLTRLATMARLRARSNSTFWISTDSSVLAQFRRGQIDLFLKLTLCFFQGIGHGVDALFQHASSPPEMTGTRVPK